MDRKDSQDRSRRNSRAGSIARSTTPSHHKESKVAAQRSSRTGSTDLGRPGYKIFRPNDPKRTCIIETWNRNRTCGWEDPWDMYRVTLRGHGLSESDDDDERYLIRSEKPLLGDCPYENTGNSNGWLLSPITSVDIDALGKAAGMNRQPNANTNVKRRPENPGYLASRYEDQGRLDCLQVIVTPSEQWMLVPLPLKERMAIYQAEQLGIKKRQEAERKRKEEAKAAAIREQARRDADKASQFDESLSVLQKSGIGAEMAQASPPRRTSTTPSSSSFTQSSSRAKPQKHHRFSPRSLFHRKI